MTMTAVPQPLKWFGVIDTRTPIAQNNGTTVLKHRVPKQSQPFLEATMSDSHSTAPVEYRELDDFPGYRVGNDGSLQSCWTKQQLGNGMGTRSVIGKEWRSRKAVVLPSGRRMFHLVRNGRRFSKYAYHLVLLAFVGQRPKGREACHKNGICDDDRADNLRWGTHTENMGDLLEHGTRQIGESHHNCKIKKNDVLEIRCLCATGQSRKSVAQQFGIGYQSVCDIVHRRTWNHV